MIEMPLSACVSVSPDSEASAAVTVTSESTSAETLAAVTVESVMPTSARDRA